MNLCPNKPLPVLLVIHTAVRRHRSPHGLTPYWPWIAFLLGTALGWLLARTLP